MKRREFFQYITSLLFSISACRIDRKNIQPHSFDFAQDKPNPLPEGEKGQKITASKKVIIVGGGLSGLTAGIHLIERGFEVEIFEKFYACGGKLSSYKESHLGCDISLEHGFHAWWGQYHNLIDMMKKLNLERNLKEIPSVKIRVRGMSNETIYFRPRVYPFFLLFPLLFSRNISFREIMQSVSIGTLILGYDKKRYDRRFDNISANDLMEIYNVPENVQRIFFEPFLKAGFFADPQEISAASFLELFHFYLSGNIGDFRCYHIGGNPQEKIIEPMVKYFLDRGGRINFNSEVMNLIVDDDKIKGIVFEEGIIGQSIAHRGDYFIVATDIPGAQTISNNVIKGLSEDKGDEFKKILGLKTNTCIVTRIWFSKPVRADRTPVGFTSNFKFITVYFILSMLNDDVRECSKNTGTQCIEFIISGIPEVTNVATDGEIIELITPEIIELFPEFKNADVVDYFMMRHDNYTFFHKGALNLRPSVQSTIFTNLFYSGDWVYLDTPVFFMEKAVMTAKIAVNHILLKEGIAPIHIYLPNVRGIF